MIIPIQTHSSWPDLNLSVEFGSVREVVNIGMADTLNFNFRLIQDTGEEVVEFVNTVIPVELYEKWDKQDETLYPLLMSYLGFHQR